jgi:hypothetical protein
MENGLDKSVQIKFSFRGICVIALFWLETYFKEYAKKKCLSSKYYIVSGWMGTIESRSIIPHSPIPDSPLPTPHNSGVTGIDISYSPLSLTVVSISCTF